MKRFFFLIAIVTIACRRNETPVPPPPQQTAAPSTSMAPAPTPRKRITSTAEKCGGDGSYDSAVDCFRIASRLRFTVDSPALSGSGELTRRRIGEEHLDLSLKDGHWIAEPRPTGIAWMREGQKATPSPEMERLYQRLTLYLDPQKKEGVPSLAGVEPLAGTNTNHFRFTDANNGESYDVWTSLTDGHIVQMKVGGMVLAFR